MWAAIKKAINSRLNRKNCKALDEIIYRNAYSNYYDIMRAMYGDGNGEIIIIPKGTTEIPAKAYMNNQDVRIVVMPLGLQKIGNMAFQGCPNLKTLIIPEGVTDIGFQIVNPHHTFDEIRIPKSVVNVAEDAFYLVFGNMYVDLLEGENATAPWGFIGNVHYDTDF